MIGLNLERIKEKIIDELRKENFTTESYPAIHFIIDMTTKEIKRRIKEACESYLKYKNNPELFCKENSFTFKIKGISEKHLANEKFHRFMLNDKDKYNDWLFKLIFNFRGDEHESEVEMSKMW